ncbi:Rne/Rng family ribonuclease [Neogemmobacter tilapiae]|uniref:Ribonuclease E n=1 Tax=Neogemmobacter tilapiae TaxID=875041 RepID=A0A918WK33_9RHOB|nr:ribonuclease E/G [Gemmobacter tilapiae]GHC58789.1 ribonuclease E [Gemmobacter tilapiae]
MAKKMLIDATHAEETRVVVVDGNKVEEFDFETVNKRQLAGNIYLAKVTRVEPSLQAAFVEYGGNRHGFLAFAEIHPDYYQIPVEDRKALLEEERALARAEDEEDERPRGGRSSGDGGNRRRSRRGPKPATVETADQVVTGEIGGMDVVDLGEEVGADALIETARTEEPPVEDHAAEDHAHHHAHDGHDHKHDHDHEVSAENGEKTYHAVDHASEIDDEIESVAEEDVHEEISAPRKPRSRRYKIQEVIKVRQIMLVQVVKEERGNKGAALTTYLSLAGRYCVLMPNTARGGGISRKITQATDRKKLKEIASELEVPEGAGLIIRTAGSKRTKAEIKRDYEYLMRLWEQIRETTLKSIAPASIYEEGNLIKRTIRDLFSREIDEVLVEGEAGFRTAKDFMRMIMPAHAPLVKRYTDTAPLFARFQVENYLSAMFNPVVQLKSGGYIVIGVTEALVAIDVNSGRATKEGSIEDTALKTNLEAADEVARQLRLRDLAGLIVIDFIDMEERRNNAAVEKRLKDKLKTDRARIQVGRISGFGLMEMSRQRLRPGMLESTTQACPSCHGTGLIRSSDSLALTILRQLEEEGTKKRSKEVVLRAPVAVINFLMNQKREHIALIEQRYGMAVRIEADPHLVSPDFSIEKLKVATRLIPEGGAVTLPGMQGLADGWVEEDEIIPLPEDEEDEAEVEGEGDEAPEAVAEGEGLPGSGGAKKKRRRRRRGKKPGQADGVTAEGEEDGDEAEVAVEPLTLTEPVEVPEAGETKPKARSRTRSRKKPEEAVADAAPVAAAADVAAEVVVAEEAPAKPSRSRRKKPDVPVAEAGSEAAVDAAEVVAEKPKAKTSRARKPKAEAAVAEVEVAAESGAEPAPVAEPPAAPKLQADPGLAAEASAVLHADPQDPVAAPEPESPKEPEPPKERRKGWWSLGR